MANSAEKNNKLMNQTSVLGGTTINTDLTDTVEKNASGIINSFSLRPQAKYVTGARTILRINGKLFGQALGVSWKIETLQDEIRTIDEYMVHEYAPKMIRVSGTITGLKIPGKGASATKIQSDIASFLFHRYISIEVRDSATDELLFFAPKAVIDLRDEQIRSEQLASVTLSWRAIGWKDEVDPQFPNNHDKTSKEAEKNGVAASFGGWQYEG